MSLYVEVDSLEKGCKVLVDLDLVFEIAPLAAGGCELFWRTEAIIGGKISLRVKNPYSQFAQFAMQTVSSEDIEKRVKSLKTPTVKMPEIPKL